MKEDLSAPRRQNPSRHVLSEHLSGFFSLDSDSRPPESADFRVLASALNETNSQSPLVQQLVSQLLQEADDPSAQKGVPQGFLDSLDRVPKKSLKDGDSCSICTVRYLDDQYPLVVRLPCNRLHHFDLECIAPWLKLHSTCPLCRKDLLAKPEVLEDSEEEFDDTFG